MRRSWAAIVAAVGSVFALAPAGAAPAEEDQWVVTLTSGKKYTGEVISRREDGLTIRIGDSDITLPVRMVSRVDRIAAEPPPREEEPEPEVPAEGAGGEDGGEPGEGGEAAPEGETAAPRPAALLLVDGSIVEGFVVARGGGLLWVVPAADLRAVSEDEISETFGETSGAGGGISFSGDALKDSRKMLDELASGDPLRITVAATVLDRYGAEAGPVLIEGLKHPKGEVRRQCIALLQSYRVKRAVTPVLGVLRNDFDPNVRAAAAAGMFEWNSPEVRRALMDAAWRDRAESVKIAALNTLARCATAEEATALMDLLAIFSGGSAAEKSVMAALQQATGQRLVDDPEVWRNWWNEGGGRALIAVRVEKIAEDRRVESEAQYRRLMQGEGEEEAPPAPAVPEAPPAPPPVTPPVKAPELPGGGN